MKKLIVNGAEQLYGEVSAGGAKNAAVAIIPATVLDDAAARFTEPLKQVLSGFRLPPREEIHFRRMFRAIVHGFASQEDEGFFSHYPASTELSIEFAIQRFIDCVLEAEKRNPS